jgi:hypothetical protein
MLTYRRKFFYVASESAHQEQPASLSWTMRFQELAYEEGLLCTAQANGRPNSNPYDHPFPRLDRPANPQRGPYSAIAGAWAAVRGGLTRPLGFPLTSGLG